MALLAYEGAFGSLKREAVFRATEKHGVPVKIVNITKETYRGSAAQVRTLRISDKIKIQKGVRQGDIRSSIPFTAALEEIFKRVAVETSTDQHQWREDKQLEIRR